MKKPRHTVTDHALVRYFERVLGHDMEQHRREIGRKIDACFRGELGMLDGACGAVVEGFEYRISPNGNVTTVIRAERPNQRDGAGGREKGDR